MDKGFYESKDKGEIYSKNQSNIWDETYWSKHKDTFFHFRQPKPRYAENFSLEGWLNHDSQKTNLICSITLTC